MRADDVNIQRGRAETVHSTESLLVLSRQEYDSLVAVVFWLSRERVSFFFLFVAET